MAHSVTAVERTWIGANPEGDGLLVIVNIDTAAEVRLLFPVHHAAEVGESMNRQSRALGGIAVAVASERERPAVLDS